MGKISRLTPFLLSLITLLGIQAGGIFSFTGLLILFVVHPLLDELIGTNADYSDTLNDTCLNFLSLFYVPFQFIFLAYAASQILRSTNVLEMLGISISAGIITGGLGITVAHELIHRTNKYERAPMKCSGCHKR